MLQSLYIKNFALIDEIEIQFTFGLNIIIGETGAGKSIIIDALMQTLGERSDVNLIKSGEQKSIIEAIFKIKDGAEIFKLIPDVEFSGSEITLRREISTKGTSRAFINDTPVSISTLKELGTYLVDFHGQHSHQQLLSPKFQLRLLDAFIKNTNLLRFFQERFSMFQKVIKEYNELLSKINLLDVKTEDSKQILKEIEQINPQPNEINEIEHELLKLENSELIYSTLNEIYNLSYLSESSVVETLAKIIRQLKSVTKFDKTLETFYDELLVAENIINEFSKQIYNRINQIEFDPVRIENHRARLRELKYLEKKFIAYENIFREKEKINKLLNELKELKQELNYRIQDITSLKAELKEVAIMLHQKRLESATHLEKSLPKVLSQLGMQNSKFLVQFSHSLVNESSLELPVIEVDQQNVKLNDSGFDEVEFLIATNPNGKLLPLSSIASGGEISRIMLALKSLVANVYDFPTMIFDEIDAGISGKVARMAGTLMKKLSQDHQIIAVTHLPQIAAASDNIILVSKMEDGNSVSIKVKTLNDSGKIEEIAKLFSGTNVTSSAYDSALNLIKEYQDGES
ncbi:MAG: DNA repair protein RecN [Candidatus Kapaibacteriales bacterium]